jgi:hypothetical protein
MSLIADDLNIDRAYDREREAARVLGRFLETVSASIVGL